MSNEVAVARTTSDLAEKMDWSLAMAKGSLIPAQYRNNPANLLFAIEYADALGIERINAITEIFVIEGKPSASANLIAGLIRKAGHVLRVEGNDTYATATLIRKDDPDHPMTATWNMEKARAAGLTGKGVWKAYPGAMLRSRAITEVARMGATDATLGLAYTAEELGAEVDSQGNPTKVSGFTSAVVTGSGADRMREVLGVDEKPKEIFDGEDVDQPTEPTPPTDDLWPEVKIGEPSRDSLKDAGANMGPGVGGLVSEKQLGLIGVLMKQAGMTDKETAQAYVRTVVNRNVASSAELSSREASDLITALKAKLAAEAQGDE